MWPTPRAYLIDCAHLLKPGGLMILATLNRTFKALAFAKVGAEYVPGLAAPRRARLE